MFLLEVSSFLVNQFFLSKVCRHVFPGVRQVSAHFQLLSKNENVKQSKLYTTTEKAENTRNNIFVTSYSTICNFDDMYSHLFVHNLTFLMDSPLQYIYSYYNQKLTNKCSDAFKSL